MIGSSPSKQLYEEVICNHKITISGIHLNLQESVFNFHFLFPLNPGEEAFGNCSKMQDSDNTNMAERSILHSTRIVSSSSYPNLYQLCSRGRSLHTAAKLVLCIEHLNQWSVPHVPDNICLLLHTLLLAAFFNSEMKPLQINPRYSTLDGEDRD